MIKRFMIRLTALMLTCCMLLSSAPIVPVSAAEETNALNSIVTNNEMPNIITDGAHNGEYNEGVVLVKVKESFHEVDLGDLEFTSVEPLYQGSKWYVVTLADKEKTEDAVQYLTGLSSFDAVDYDYIMKVTAEMASVDVSGNPNYESQSNLNVHKIPYGWTQNGKYPGGSPDVVVAVIDTGVDYNHEDLNNNIWINSAEIPNNGRDDDGNGYIDDVYGWDCVNDDNDPMDDNGHGTHVAGIIAAENNKKGGVGVAFGCKVMVLKAGNSSGHFNNSDIAEAIQYAYMNGASVINMSFAGTDISIAAEEALANAYNTCVLVAASGNSNKCTLPGCIWHFQGTPFFPAALPYVIGVMSVDNSGNNVSSFSNFNHPGYNEYKYNVYAAGEAVSSCWPNNKYATLTGTSMAAPMVAGIAALIRSAYPDREAYSSKFIQSQIVNTGTQYPYNAIIKDVDQDCTVVDVFAALTKAPTPSIYAMDYRIDDSKSISSANNGNGTIDAGETVRLYCSFFNKGGVASNVQVSIDTMRNDDPSLLDPYFTFVNPSMHISDIGTYSERETGDQYFEIVVDSKCPNEYIVNFNIRLSYRNGVDSNDKNQYSGLGVVSFNVSNGYRLGGAINADTTFDAGRRYIIGEDLVIAEGVTVTFKEGCQIQYYDGREYYNSPLIINYGTLKFQGSAENVINIFPSDSYSTFMCGIKNYGNLYMDYVSAVNLYPFMCYDEVLSYEEVLATINNSELRQNTQLTDSNGSYCDTIFAMQSGNSDSFVSCNNFGFTWHLTCPNFSVVNSYIENISRSCQIYNQVGTFSKCLIKTKNGYVNQAIEAAYSDNIIYSCTASFSSEPASQLVVREAKNNLFINDFYRVHALLTLNFVDSSQVSGNAFSKDYQKFASQVINGYYDVSGKPIVDVYGSLADASKLWPHVVNVELFDKNGNPTTTVGKEEIKVRVTFNRPMDTSRDTFVTFGTIEPYADYRINGKYISNTVWEGTYTLKAQIENGQNYLKVNNACAAEDQTKKVFGEYQLHEFTIDTTAAMSSSMVANSTAKGIELSWLQDDYDTLMGYNIYRATSENGDYVKINPAIVLDAYSTYTDADVEAGETYWYTFTTVLSDFSESLPAGKVSAVAKDTIPPTITHTPVTSGYLNRNINIYCNATDNIEVASVTLYFRAIGETQWHTRNMAKAGTRYGATIYGSETNLAGLEYYIVASDGNGEGFCGGVNDAFRINITHASEDHTFAGEWYASADGHWQLCSICNEKGTVKAHKPGTAATETTPQVCTECGFVLKAALGHTHKYGNTYSNNDQLHWYECTCGAKTNVGDHVFDNACDPDCNTCGYTIARAHLYDNDCDPRCNKCGETRETQHQFDNGVVTKEPTTTKYGEMTYTCTICGAEKYEDIDMLPKEEEKKPVEEEKPKGGCYIATCVYGSYDCSEVWTLRRFRDDTLASTWLGRTFVRTYYAISPTLVDWFGDDAWFQTAWRSVLDVFVDALNWLGVEDTAYEDKVW